MGFDYFYGFVGGDANQWGPNLFRNTTQIYPWMGHEGTLKMDRSDPKAEIWPVTGKEPSWNLITAMADDAIDWMYRIHQTDPRQPIFLYYVPGSSHAPHHPTKEWVDKIHAMHLFDDGYEKLRERIFENQQKLGVIPKGLKLTPWPSDVLTPWDQLTPEEKKLFIRQVEVFAAYVAYNDYEIGRVIQAFEDLGKLDNTLIIYQCGDNGTSAEGGPQGTYSEVAFFNGYRPPVDVQTTMPGAPNSHTTTCRRAGRGRLTPLSTGSSRTPLGSAAPTRTWSSRGRRASRTREVCASSSCTTSTSCRHCSKSPASPRPNTWTVSSRSLLRA